jgi:hypothetical protein
LHTITSQALWLYYALWIAIAQRTLRSQSFAKKSLDDGIKKWKGYKKMQPETRSESWKSGLAFLISKNQATTSLEITTLF